MRSFPHTLVFIRHGETDWNVEQRFQGQKDIPLNANGRAQAHRQGEVLAELLPNPGNFDFVSSPLVRARQTMEIMRAAMGLDPAGYRVDEALKEITFGDWEGFTLAELERAGAAGVTDREADKWGFLHPRGESYAILADRVAAWVGGLARDTVAVSHGAVGRCVRGELLGIPPRAVPGLDAPQDRLFFYRGGEARWH